MDTKSIRKRIERGIVLAATQRPRRFRDFWIVNGWHCAPDSCACTDHEIHPEVTCKHMAACAVWEAREHVRGAARFSYGRNKRVD